MDEIELRPLAEGDCATIALAFAAQGWQKSERQFRRYLEEQARGERVVLVAWLGDAFAGYVTVVWRSDYRPFEEAGIPEIVDFNVLMHLRRRGIGTQLLDEAERRIAVRSRVAGIAVGLFDAYGAAQRLYVQRGYVPDGRGIILRGHQIRENDMIVIDNDVGLYLTKDLDRP